MAADDGILGLLGRMNDPQALYGGALSDERTRQAMAGRGLLAMASSFADSAMPTRMPTPFGAVLGHAAGAAGASEDTLMEARLRNAQAQQAMANVGLLNQMGPAYQMFFDAAKKEQERLAAAGGIPQAAPPGTAPGTVGAGTGTGKPPTGPIDPELVTWHAKNLGLDPLIAHTALDIESSYGTNTGNDKSPSNTGAYQRAKADEPGGQNDTLDNQVKLGVGDLATARVGLRARLGREPTNAEVYLAHQQGVGGAVALITHPDEPAGKVIFDATKGKEGGLNISNNGGDPQAPASAFVQHWANEYNKREGRFASLAAPSPPNATVAQAPLSPPGTASLTPPGGLLNLPDPTGATDRMNLPIPGIGAGVAPGAPGPAPPVVPPGAAAAVAPPSAGNILMAAQQRNANIPGAGLPAGGLVADASGKVVPVPPAPPPGPPPAPPPEPAAPNLLPGGRAIPGLLGGGAAPPPGPPPGPAPGQPTPLVMAPPQTAEAPVPPAARPPVPVPAPPVPAPAAPPMAAPPGAPPPPNLPMPPTTMPPMPAGGLPSIQPTPMQLIAQGIVGLSSLTGHPAPDYMQKLAGQPLEMQMEAYKAYVGEQAKQLTAKYQKELDASAARYIAFETSQGNLPADLTKMNTEQALKLRNDMLTQHGMVQDSTGHWAIDPTWLNAQAQKAYATARGPAEFKTVTVDVPDDPNNPNGPMHKQTMSEADFRDWQSGRGGPGAGTGTAGIISGKGDTGTGGTAGAAPGARGAPVYNPGQEKGMGAVAEQNAKDYAKVHTDADAALQMQTQATNMRQEATNFYTGPGAEYNQSLNKVIATLTGDPERANKVASYETFIKDAGFFAREQARLMGARVGVQELSMVRDSLAGPTTTARGIDRVMAQVQGLSDFRLIKQQAMNDYVNRPGAAPGGWDNNGFEAQFNKNVSPYTLMVLRLSAQDRAELLDKLGQSKEGLVDIQRLQAQHKYLADNNLLPR